MVTISYFANSDWYFYNFRAPLVMATRRAFDAEIHCLCPDGPYRHRLEAMGFHWFEIPLERQGINPFTEWSLLQRVRKILRDTQPNLLHNFTLKSVIWGTLAAQAEGVPAIVNALAGLGSVFRGNSMKGALIRPIVKGLLRYSFSGPYQRIIFQNPDDLQFAITNLGIVPSTATLIRGSGVDTSRFTPAYSRPDPPIVLFVGRLLKDKGILEFCAAAKIIHINNPQVRFQIAGSPDSGNPSSLLQSDVERISANQPYLEFLAHVEDMVKLYRKASIMTLPSTYGEGVPRSLIEAASCGLPLVATDHPGCREIVLDGINGFTVPPNNAHALAEVIQLLLQNSTLMDVFGARGRALVTAEFSEKLVINQTLQVYRDLLTHRR